MYLDTVKDLLANSEQFDTLKHDHLVNANDVAFTEDDTIGLPRDLFNQAGMRLEMDRWSWNQVFSKLAPLVYGPGTTRSLPGEYLLSILPEHRAMLINEHVQRYGEGHKWFVRGYDHQCRAILSDGYKAVGITDLLGTIDTVVQDQGGNYQLVRSWVSPHRMAVRLLIQNVDTPHGVYGLGAYFENGEIGNASVRVLPFVQRTSCTNSTIWQDDGLTVRHANPDLITNAYFIKAKVVEVLNGSAEVLDRLLQAEDEQLPNFSDVVDGLAQRFGWNKEVRDTVLMGSEGKRTRAGLVHGVTYAAHAATDDPEAGVEMEKLGGRILAAPRSLFSEAARRVNQEA